MQYDLNVVGSNVAKCRRQLGWTREELASRLQLLGWNVTVQNIVSIENLQCFVRDMEVVLFSEALRVPVGKLFSPRLQFVGRATR